jgi:hypothetical protein
MVAILKVKNNIQIVLHKGGFAGDLVTALYDQTALLNLNSTGKISLRPERTLLQQENQLSLDEKNSLLEQQKVLSVCDPEFSLLHQKGTLFLYSSDKKMTDFFCHRFAKHNPEYFKSVIFWINKFTHKLDMSKIFEDYFLDNMPFMSKDDTKVTLFENWKKLNSILQ